MKPQNYIEAMENPAKPMDLDFSVDMAVPNQSMSIKEIVQRFTLGQSLSIGRSVYYDGDPDFDDDTALDSPEFDLSDVSEAQRLIEREKAVRGSKSGGRKETKEPKEPSEGAKADEPGDVGDKGEDSPT